MQLEGAFMPHERKILLATHYNLCLSNRRGGKSVFDIFTPGELLDGTGSRNILSE